MLVKVRCGPHHPGDQRHYGRLLSVLKRIGSFITLLGLLLLRGAELVLLGAVAAALCGVALYGFFGRDLPDPATLATHRPFETTRIYARDGETLLYEVFADGQRTVVSLAEIPLVLQAATIAVEDGNFWQNPGVDVRSIVRALYLNRNGEVMSGGSTITQQLVRRVLLEAGERNEQSYRRKAREAILALRLSRQFSKAQILGLYLNEIYYGNLAYGAEAAAQTYFGTSVRDLDLAQASLLAGLPQAPNELDPFTYPDAAKARQRIVLDALVKQGAVSKEEANTAYAAKLTLRSPHTTLRYPHWVFLVRDWLDAQYGPELVGRGGLRVVTTLDPALQHLAETAVAAQLVALRAKDATNAAVVVIEPATNELRAMVGSADYNDASIDGEVNVALAARQPGSTLKPLVYALALANGWTPATIMWDTPTAWGEYRPQNYDNTFRGPQRLRMALAGSLNIPALKALEFVGLERFLDSVATMGIGTLTDRERYGLAVALGAGEVTLFDLATAYTTLANGGSHRPTTAVLRVTTSHGEVLFNYERPAGTPTLGANGPQIAYLIGDILSDNAARSPIFGPNSVLRLPDDRPAAVKTGTSNDYHDSWAVGWTPDMVVGVWVGNSDNRAMQEVAGANGAGTIWNQIMQQAHEGQPHVPFVRPPEIVEAEICAATGLPADGCADAVNERFVSGTLPQPDKARYITVTVGGDGTCLATDSTPAAERRRQVFLLPPADARDWAQRANVAQPPTVACAPPQTAQTQPISGSATLALPPAAAALIAAPRSGETVRGVYAILGSAAGQYQLDYGLGSAPTAWTPIASGFDGVQNGLLAQWRTETLAPGSYTLRLVVTLPGNPQQESRVQIVVNAASLTVRLEQPFPDAVIPQSTTVQLVATVTGNPPQVEFFVDDQPIGRATGPRPSISWTALAPGRHTLTVVATGAAGERITSQAVVVRVE